MVGARGLGPAEPTSSTGSPRAAASTIRGPGRWTGRSSSRSESPILTSSAWWKSTSAVKASASPRCARATTSSIVAVGGFIVMSTKGRCRSSLQRFSGAWTSCHACSAGARRPAIDRWRTCCRLRPDVLDAGKGPLGGDAEPDAGPRCPKGAAMGARGPRAPHPVRPGELAADHPVPLVLGGEPLPARPGVLCASCNARKGLSERRR
jgi:hypothetical protein